MEYLASDMLVTSPSVEVQKAMGKDIRAAAKKLSTAPGFFVLADEVPVKDKKIPFFVVVKTEAEAKDWVLKVKGRKPKAVVTGQCTLQLSGTTVSVSLVKVTGDRAMALKALKLAFRTDPMISLADLAEKPAASPAAAAATPAAPGTAARPATTPAPAASISPKVDAMVERLPASDRPEIAQMLKEFEGLGLSARQLEEALRETFSRK